MTYDWHLAIYVPTDTPGLEERHESQFRSTAGEAACSAANRALREFSAVTRAHLTNTLWGYDLDVQGKRWVAQRQSYPAEVQG